MRGDINDPITISQQLLGAFIMILISYYALTQFLAVPVIASNPEATAAVTGVRGTFTLFDYLIPAVYVLLSVLSFILASMVFTHIGFLPVTIFVSGFQLIMSYAITQVYTAIAGIALFAPALANFSNTQLFFTNLGLINAVSIIIIIVVLYAKRRTPQTQTQIGARRTA